MNLPRISVITPSFNQGKFIEETINSVLAQEYPELEYIVIDGGSADNTLEILRRYSHRLSYWTSEKDSGQGDALAKGFAKASGDVLCWLCSDDLLKPGTLWIVAGAFRNDPKLDLVYGDTEYLYPNGSTRIKRRVSYDYRAMLYAFNIIAQPSAFFTMRAYRSAGGIDPTMNYAMDYDLFLKMGATVRTALIPLTLSSYRLHPNSKTVVERKQFDREWERARSGVLGHSLTYWHRSLWYLYTAKIVWKYLVERGELKFGYDNSKYAP